MPAPPPLFSRPWLCYSALVAFALSPCWTGRLNPQDYQGGRSRDNEARAYRNASSVAAMLGEIRTTFSDILFIKSERYLHSGVGYVAHVQDEILSVSGAMEHADEHQAEVFEHGSDEPHDQDACDHHHDHPHGDDHAHSAELLLRSLDNDFRGWIGNMERAVKPYNSPDSLHVHTDGRELLPWFRTMTLSDRHHITGYATGAWWLQARDPKQALLYINEGIRYNPHAFQLYFTKGQILMSMARSQDPDLNDLDEASRRLVAEAARTFHRGAAEVCARWKEFENWTSYDKEDAWALLRLDAITEKNYGDPDVAKARARDYLHLAGGHDVVLARLAGTDQ